ncbi:MarR family winged helix-turn-helix transcriptional regulator [Bradyrhizobium sp. USDA 4452]
MKQDGWNPSESPTMLVTRCAHLLARQNDSRFRALGISVNQLPVLVQLKDGSSRTQGELTRFAGIEQPSMAELLRRMERDGLVVREPNPTDRRSSLIKLADHVFNQIGAARAALTETSNMALEGFSTEETELLVGLLRRIIANLGDDDRWFTDAAKRSGPQPT